MSLMGPLLTLLITQSAFSAFIRAGIWTMGGFVVPLNAGAAGRSLSKTRRSALDPHPPPDLVIVFLIKITSCVRP